MQVEKSVTVEQSVLDLCEQVAALLAAVKAAGGFEVSAIPAEVAAIVVGLPKIVADIGAIPAELSDSKLLALKSATLGVYEILAALGLK